MVLTQGVVDFNQRPEEGTKFLNQLANTEFTDYLLVSFLDKQNTFASRGTNKKKTEKDFWFDILCIALGWMKGFYDERRNG